MHKYHNPKIMYVTDVTIRIKDEAEMIKFYEEAMGFTVLSRTGNEIALGTKSGTKLVTLIVDPSATVVNGTIGLYHYAILLPTRRDLATFLLHYVQKGYTFVGASDHHVSEALYVEDPEGNGIEIYVDRPDTLWRREEGAVFMNTLRLDVNKLLELRDPSGFTTIAEGTIMGHIHLHVNSIKEADNFFVGKLGFDRLLMYGDAAEFTSNAGYHHHIAFNTWRGAPVPKGKVITGLVGYHLNIPSEAREEFISKITANGVKVTTEGSKVSFIDVNGSVVTI